jgi:hypothetical protein
MVIEGQLKGMHLEIHEDVGRRILSASQAFITTARTGT